MSWVKKISIVEPSTRYRSVISGGNSSGAVGSSEKEPSVLPEIYSGYPQRIDRYSQYDQMDMDPEVSIALDTISEFSTQRDESDPNRLFEINYNEEPSDTELNIISQCLLQWCRVNKFKQRLWRIFRDTIKYGDQFFIRDPDTFEWLWVNHEDVNGVVANQGKGKKITDYLMRNLDLNLDAMNITPSDNYGSNIMGTGTNSLDNNMNANRFGNVQRSGRYSVGNENTTAVDANFVIHLSLCEGIGAGWPFATSILESVYKPYRQKELLEDAIIIYRIQRAPERRVYYVDVGDVPEHRAQQKIERFKNEFRQRKIPTKNGDGLNVVDAAYNPMSQIEDIFIPVTPDGRGSKVDTLPGGQSVGQIDDLKYFNNKMIRGLRIPSSYIPTGPEDSNMQYNDGRMGVSYVQEYRFANYCKRFQNLIAPVFDSEFKLFIKEMGFDIDSNLFELDFIEPQKFDEYSRAERDVAMINTFSPLVDVKFISKRTLLTKYLGWSEDEVVENEISWKEENLNTLKSIVGDSTAEDISSSMDSGPGLDSVGIRADDTGDVPMTDDQSGDSDMSMGDGDTDGGESNEAS